MMFEILLMMLVALWMTTLIYYVVIYFVYIYIYIYIAHWCFFRIARYFSYFELLQFQSAGLRGMTFHGVHAKIVP